MNHSNPDEQRELDSAKKKIVEADSSIRPPADGAGEKSQKPLSPEEQMALYEKDLKENDWGHQPC